MSRVVAIIKTAKDQPLWKGLPDDYPVSCKEYDNADLAQKEHPGCLVMKIADYHDYAAKFHEKFPAPADPPTENCEGSPSLWTKIKQFFGGL